MMKKIIIIAILMFVAWKLSAQQYTPMTAAGYQFKRILCDSTLHIPSFCGLPTLRNSIAKNGALAMDTCGNKLYIWTNAIGWSTLASIDTTSLSNRINLKIDSIKRSTDSIYAYKNGQWVFQYKDSTGGSLQDLQSVLEVGSLTNHSINMTDSILGYNQYKLNSSELSPFSIITNLIDYKSGETGNINTFKITDSAVSYGAVPSIEATGNLNTSPSFYKIGIDYNTGIPSIKFQGSNSKALEFDNTSIYANDGFGNSTYLKYPHNDTTRVIVTSVNGNYANSDGVINISTGSGTVTSIIGGYGLNGGTITSSGTLSVDTATLNGLYAQNGRYGNDTATIVMAKVHNNSGSTLTNGKVVFLATSGTNSDAPSVRLANNKHDSTSANTFGFVSGSIANNDTGWIILSGKIEKLNTSAFANGDIIYLDSVSGNWTKTKPVAPYHMVYLGVVVKANSGNGSIFVKCQNGYELDEIHDVQITNKLNNQILVYSDTQKVWKNRNVYSVVDTSSLSNRINLKVNISDTATMLSNYAKTNSVNTKLNISDTATMLTPYLRSNIASATYLAKSDSATYYTKYRSDTSRTNIYNALNSKPTYTFSTGVTNSSGTITSNLSTGVAGGQSVIGGTSASDTISISSTTNATKGRVFLGNTSSGSTFFENTNNLTIGSRTDAGYKLDVNGTARIQGNTTFGSTGLWDNTNTRFGINQTSPTSKLHLNFNQNSVTQSDANGILLANSTAAISGTQSISPAIVWQGNGWKTTATAASQDVRYRADVLPVQGTTNPTGIWRLASSINGNAYNILFQSTSSGNHTFNDGSGNPLLRIFNTGDISFGSGYLYNTSYYIASTQFKIGLNASNGVYKVTNSAGNITPSAFFGNPETITAGTLGFTTDITNGISFTAGNGTSHISRASINITNLTNTAGSESADMIFLTQSGGTAMSEKMRITSGGGITLTATNTAAGTTGNQTINKPSGTVNIAAAGTSVTVTNNLVTANSIVFATIRTNDATAVIKNVVPASGSFTINLNAATTAETSIGFFVINQ